MRTSRRLAAIGLAVLFGALFLAGPASAKVVYKWVYAGPYPNGTFEGHDAIPDDGITPSLHDIRIDQQANALYGAYSLPVEFGEAPRDRLYKFGLDGHSSPWAALDPNTFIERSKSDNKFAVDNTGGPTQGRIYVLNHQFGEEEVYVYLPSGEQYLGGKFPVNPPGFGPCGIAVAPDGNFWISFENFSQGQFEPNGYFEEFNPEGERTGEVIYSESTNTGSSTFMCDIEFDSKGNLYNDVEWTYPGETFDGGGLAKFSPTGVKHRGSLDTEEITEYLQMAIDQSTDDLFVADRGEVRQYDSEGGLVGSFGGPEGSYPGMGETTGVAVDEDTHAVYVSQAACCPIHRVDKFIRTEPKTVPTAETVTAEPTPATATLRGVVNADGIDTTQCTFEWGPDIHMENTAPCIEGNVFTGASGDHAVHAEIGGLVKGREYHYRLLAKNANGIPSRGIASSFRASSPPTVTHVTAGTIDTGGAHLIAEVVPNGSTTHFQFEWGTEANNYTHTAPLDPHPPENAQYLFNETKPKVVDEPLAGLQEETTYHFRFVAVNDAGTTASQDQAFTTFAKDPPGDDCANAHVRQQTGTRLLLDCRAYELVTAANAGGYNVESDLSLGEAPLVSSPLAEGRLLYSLHYGSVPGAAGNPTDFGHDPYLAVRGANGWSTEYVGLPADAMNDPEPYGSPLLGSDAGLGEFAFGGENICDPCFADGSTNIPFRHAGGPVEKGMAGSLSPAGNPSGKVAKVLSDDGSHLVFGSDAQFESNGDPAGSIYDRDLKAGTTQVVSTLPSGATITGGEVAELDISGDGSRILVGKKMGVDGNQNGYWQPYMHIGKSANTVDLAPGTTTGVLYAGMSSDGSKVFYSTKDKLLPEDTDTSADIYEADVPASGPATLSLVSVDGTTPSNSDACTPPDEWNSVSGGPDCSPVAFAGGAGVSANGAIYFLSPEQLDGPSHGEVDQPNLYLHRGGQPTRFVATIDTSVGKPPPPPPKHPLESAVFGGTMNGPEAMTVDQSNGDLYVVEASAGSVSRFDSTGAQHKFTAGPGEDTNKIPGLALGSGSTSEVAVDGSSSAFGGDIYVTNGPKISVYAPSGEKLGDLDGSTDAFGAFFEPCGVAVDKSNGAVYIGDHAGAIWRYAPTGSAPVSDADYSVSAVITTEFHPCSVAVDSIGNVYAAGRVESELPPDGPVRKFTAGEFQSPYAVASGTQVAAAAKAIATDPQTNELYVNDGAQVTVFTPGAAAQNGTYGLGKLTGSRGIAVNSNTLDSFAPNGGNVVQFGFAAPTHVLIDNPAVLHALGQAETHSYGDFQVTPDGEFAAFSAARSLTGYPNGGHTVLYRYDADSDELACVSCPTTGIDATADTSLPPYGLGLTDEGQVFFTTGEQLVLRDTNSKKDAYEWEEGKQQLISNGLSPLDSSLLGVSASGTDAFFFTNEVLAAGDQNGNAVKVYDARANGGYPFLPDAVPCSASDECHGPGTQQPGPPSINTVEGAGPSRGNVRPCRKGFVERHQKCVKRHKKHHGKRHAHRKHHRGAHNG